MRSEIRKGQVYWVKFLKDDSLNRPCIIVSSTKQNVCVLLLQTSITPYKLSGNYKSSVDGVYVSSNLKMIAIEDIMGYITELNSKDMEIVDRVLETHGTRRNKSMKYPENILRIVRQNLSLEPTDINKDDEINAMSQSEILDRVCEWEGFIGYGRIIRGWIKDIYGINLDEK